MARTYACAAARVRTTAGACDRVRAAARISLACAWLASVAACGGGGGGGGSPIGGVNPIGGGAPTPPTWTAGSYPSITSVENRCAVPRTGTDPSTGRAYADTQGSTTWENHWLRSWSNAYYLWYSELPDVNPASQATTAGYFELLKTSATTASGSPKDRFHFTYPTPEWIALSQSGQQVGYGIEWSIVASRPPRRAVVAYVQPNSPGSAAQVARGAEVLTIDGVDLVNAADQTSVDTLNAGLAPSRAGEQHTFGIRDFGASTTRTITLTAQNITTVPVQNVRTVQTASGVVGYLTFNDHIATAERQLVDAVNQLAGAGISDLVVDLRYNGGGYLDLASEFAYMIAGPSRTSGRTFELQQFNDKFPNTNPITGGALQPVPFHSTAQGLSVTSGTSLPTLNLGRVFLLTGPGTCSASESIINSLRGIDVEVVQIGSTTCGKPYGFYPDDNCGTTYFTIQFRGVNAKGFGDYADGFAPQNTTAAVATRVPGCSVADDFSRELGDPLEGRFAAALAYRTSGTCPTPSGTANPNELRGADGRLFKPEGLMNRVMTKALTQ